MQTSLVELQSKDCLIFAAGWGMDPKPFSGLTAGNYDILMLYDYNSLAKVELLELKDRYRQLHLLAWSMGVWVAATIFEEQKDLFASTTAVNGTLRPIDDKYGISEKDFGAMVTQFSAATLQKFYQNMFTDPAERDRFLTHRPQRSESSILTELVALKKMYGQLGPAPDIYDTKIVGSRDRIVPARSQIRAWGRDRCNTIKAPHFPFFQWNAIITNEYQ